MNGRRLAVAVLVVLALAKAVFGGASSLATLTMSYRGKKTTLVRRGVPEPGFGTRVDPSGPIPLIFDDSAAEGYPATLPTFSLALPIEISPLLYSVSVLRAVAESMSYGFVQWSTVARTRVNVSLAETGTISPLAPTNFTLSVTCEEPYTALLTLFFSFVDSLLPGTLVDPIAVNFAWACSTPSVCPSRCAEHGKCVGSRCVCDKGYIGRDCSVGWDLSALDSAQWRVCPEMSLKADYTLPDRRGIGATDYSFAWWSVIDSDTEEITQWGYFATGGTEAPLVSGYNGTIAGAVDFAFLNLAVPGKTYLLMALQRDRNGVFFSHKLTVKSWDECGYPNATLTDCGQSRYGWNCSKGCDELTVFASEDGYFVSDVSIEADDISRSQYPNLAECTWVISSSKVVANKIEIWFSSFDIDTSDSVLVYEGAPWDDEPKLVGSYNNESPPPESLVLNCRTAHVVLWTDSAVTGRGFVANAMSRHILTPSDLALLIAFSIVGAALLAALITVAVLYGKNRREKRHRLAMQPAEPMSAELLREVTLCDMAAVCSESESKMSVTLSKTTLTFGLAPKEAFPVDKVLYDEIELVNKSGFRAAPFRVLVPSDKSRFTCTVTPSCGEVPPHDSVTLKVGLTLLFTTRVHQRLLIKLGSASETASRMIAEFQLEGAISEKLDPEDIRLETPPMASGAFGAVYRGEYRGRSVAVKVLKHQLDLSTKELELFHKEVELYTKLRSPLVVEFVGASHLAGKLCLCMEMMPLGNLASLLHKGDAKLGKRFKLKVCLNIAQGIEFLHSNGVIHRDIKPANALMVSLKWKASDILCKLTDFGTSRTVENCRELFNYTMGVGTPIYMSPELLTGEQPYSASVDIYALGLTIWEVFTRQEPWRDTVAWNIPKEVISGKRPDIPDDQIPASVAALIVRCWDNDPEARPSAKEVASEIIRILAEEFHVVPVVSAQQPQENYTGNPSTSSTAAGTNSIVQMSSIIEMEATGSSSAVTSPFSTGGPLAGDK